MSNDKKYRVLIVDDAIYVRWKIKKAFESDPRIIIVGEGEKGGDAVEMARALDPDIITLDITLREKNGIEATREIRKFNDRARILIISALGQKRKIVETVTAGADSFLLKPFTDQGLLRMIEQLKKGVEPTG